MGAAYRANGRAAPIMDAFSFHPYMLRSNEPPTTTHHDTTITIADYPKLVTTLGQAFDGTGQKGSTLPIVYDEFGVESTFPPDKAESLHRCRGPDRPSRRPGDAGPLLPAGARAGVLPAERAGVPRLLAPRRERAPGLAVGRLLRRRDAEVEPGGSARRRPTRVRRNPIACPGLQVTPRLGLRWFPQGRPTAEPSTFPISLTCDVDCSYRVRIERAATHATTLSVSGQRDRPRADHGRVPPDSAAARGLPDHGLGEGDGERRPAGDGGQPRVRVPAR